MTCTYSLRVCEALSSEFVESLTEFESAAPLSMCVNLCRLLNAFEFWSLSIYYRDDNTSLSNGRVNVKLH